MVPWTSSPAELRSEAPGGVRVGNEGPCQKITAAASPCHVPNRHARPAGPGSEVEWVRPDGCGGLLLSFAKIGRLSSCPHRGCSQQKTFRARGIRICCFLTQESLSRAELKFRKRIARILTTKVRSRDSLTRKTQLQARCASFELPTCRTRPGNSRAYGKNAKKITVLSNPKNCQLWTHLSLSKKFSRSVVTPSSLSRSIDLGIRNFI